jgi:flagellar basal body-associated protein FliL
VLVVLLVVVVVALVVVVHWHTHTPPVQRMSPPDCSQDNISNPVEHGGSVVEIEEVVVDVVVEVVVIISAKVLIFILVDVVLSVSSIVMHPQTSIIAATTAA